MALVEDCHQHLPVKRDFAAAQAALALIARLFLSAEFAIAALGKMFGWDGQAAYMAGHHLPMIPFLLGCALVIETLGVLCLLSGFLARVAASLMALYLIPVSVLLHPFWSLSGNAAGLNQTEFFKNLGMVGGLLMIAAFGPGRWALGPVISRGLALAPAGLESGPSAGPRSREPKEPR
jgi:putative oxidoreductase